MAFIGKHPIRHKIIINNAILHQVRHFKYSFCDITYDCDEYICIKAQGFQNINLNKIRLNEELAHFFER